MSYANNPNHYADVRDRFARDTRNHVMTVLHDDGLYRHLRFAEPGTGIYHYDIVTWPGHLAVSGDMGDGWSFSRTADMFSFFRQSGDRDLDINPMYWDEKMPYPLQKASKEYSAEAFRRVVNERTSEMREALSPAQRAAFVAQVERSVLRYAGDEYEAREALEDFEFHIDDSWSLRFEDNDEYEYTDYNFHFLWALFGIVTGIRTYDEHKAAIA